MKVVLERIGSADARATSELATGEVVEHRLDVLIDGHNRRAFTVFLKANVLPGLDASIVYGDELLEELLRFEPASLNSIYSLVGKFRRNGEVDLPAIILDETISSGRDLEAHHA